MSTLSFNVTHTTDAQVVDAARDAVMTLHSAGVEVGMHSKKKVADGITNVHVSFNASNALGPRVSRAMRTLSTLPNVDAVRVL